jgi:hypothetical protein
MVAVLFALTHTSDTAVPTAPSSPRVTRKTFWSSCPTTTCQLFVSGRLMFQDRP